MNRTASLLRTARELQRRIWCSLPLGFRLAHLLCALGSSALEAYGKAFYAEFLRRGVQGMPDIFGQPAAEWFAAQPVKTQESPRLADKLPSKYGYDLALSVQKILLAKFRDPHMVDEAISGFYLRFLESEARTLEGRGLREAHGYIIESVKRQLLNLIKSQGRKQEQSMFMEDDGEEKSIDIRDPKAFEHLEDAFPDWKRPKVRRDLMSIAVWVPAYLDLASEGYDDGEIFGWTAKEPYSGSTPSLLARKMGLDFVPRPGAKDQPLGRGLWSKPDTGTKVRIVDILNAHMSRA